MKPSGSGAVNLYANLNAGMDSPADTRLFKECVFLITPGVLVELFYDWSESQKQR